MEPSGQTAHYSEEEAVCSRDHVARKYIYGIQMSRILVVSEMIDT